MLSREEKKEMLADGHSRKRRKDFAQARKEKSSLSLDGFIRFLANIQKVFSPFAISRKKTITRFNKL